MKFRDKLTGKVHFITMPYGPPYPGDHIGESDDPQDTKIIVEWSRECGRVVNEEISRLQTLGYEPME